MKTPLTSIQMGARILHSGKLDDKLEKKEKHFNIIEDEAQHLLMLTNKILTISKMEAGKLELTKTEFAVSPLLLNLKNMFIAKAQKPVTFSIDTQEEMVYGDKEYLKECISNLIDNAIKYSENAVHIDLSVRSANSFVLISVKDNGFGISHKDQKIIFEKFERADGSRSPDLAAPLRKQRGGSKKNRYPEPLLGYGRRLFCLQKFRCVRLKIAQSTAADPTIEIRTVKGIGLMLVDSEG